MRRQFGRIVDERTLGTTRLSTGMKQTLRMLKCEDDGEVVIVLETTISMPRVYTHHVDQAGRP